MSGPTHTGRAKADGQASTADYSGDVYRSLSSLQTVNHIGLIDYICWRVEFTFTPQNPRLQGTSFKMPAEARKWSHAFLLSKSHDQLHSHSHTVSQSISTAIQAASHFFHRGMSTISPPEGAHGRKKLAKMPA